MPITYIPNDNSQQNTFMSILSNLALQKVAQNFEEKKLALQAKHQENQLNAQMFLGGAKPLPQQIQVQGEPTFGYDESGTATMVPGQPTTKQVTAQDYTQAGIPAMGVGNNIWGMTNEVSGQPIIATDPNTGRKIPLGYAVRSGKGVEVVKWPEAKQYEPHWFTDPNDPSGKTGQWVQPGQQPPAGWRPAGNINQMDLERQNFINQEAQGFQAQGLTPEQARQAAFTKLQTLVPTASAEARANAFGKLKPQNYYDNWSGQIETMDPNERDDMNKRYPGRFLLTTPSEVEKSRQRTAFLTDVKNRMGDVWTALDNMPEFDATQRAQFSKLLTEHDPKSAIGAFVNSQVGQTLSPEQKDFLIATRQLQENVMGIRNLTQGSPAIERVVDAIGNTIPGLATPDKDFAYRQLKALNNQLQDLSKAVPRLNNPLPESNVFPSGGGSTGQGVSGSRFKILKVQ